MKTKVILLSSIFVLFTQVSAANEVVKQGKQLFNTFCVACHGTSGGMDMSKRLAPPIIAVKKHYISSYADEDSFTNAVVSWVKEPDEDNSMMRGAIRKFNLMPAMTLPDDDLEKIAVYIFKGELDKPKGFDQHFEEAHGKNKEKSVIK